MSKFLSIAKLAAVHAAAHTLNGAASALETVATHLNIYWKRAASENDAEHRSSETVAVVESDDSPVFVTKGGQG